MSKVAVFLAVGFEEIEAISTIDVLRRGGLEVDIISASGNQDVEGAHGIIVKSDELFYDVDYTPYDALVLPGGQPGTDNLNAHEGLLELLKDFYENDKKIAAICAAPLVFGGLGLLKGKKATCYPGIEPRLTGATTKGEEVVVEGNIITAKGPGVAIDFGLAILSWFKDKSTIDKIRKALIAK